MQTPKQMCASQRRSLKAMRDKISNMADQWDEVDNYMKWTLMDLLQSIDEAIEKFETEATSG